MAVSDRHKTRRSLTKQAPAPGDIFDFEQAFCKPSGGMFIKDDEGNVLQVGGTEVFERLADLEAAIGDTEVGDALTRLTALEAFVAAVNRLPIAQAVLQAIQDTELSTTFDLMDNVTDEDIATVTVTAVTYSGVQRTVGTVFTTARGTAVINADGTGTFFPGDAARALALGATATETFGYTVTDAAGGRTSSVFHVQITGTNNGPVARADSQSGSAGETISGNVLTNDIEYEGDALTLVSFTVAGDGATYAAAAAATVTGFGGLTMQANGSYSFVPLNAEVNGSLPVVTYVGTDGVTQYTGQLRLSVAPPPPTAAQMKAFYASYREQPVITRPAPNPVVGRPLPDRSFVQDSQNYPKWKYTMRLPNQLGRPDNALDFEVGPGKPYENLHDVPWEYLLPGDRVFVYWRPEPYKEILNITSGGTEDAWLEVIGVRDEVTGAMPVLDGDQAVANNGRHADLFTAQAMVNITPMTAGVDGTVWGSKIRYIHVTGFECLNAHPSKTRRNRGATNFTSWGDFAGMFYVIGTQHICIQGNKIHHCGNPIFVNSVSHERFQTSYLHICNNWIYESSRDQSDHTHSTYTEAIYTIYEHNYIQRTVAGSRGDTIKERSSGIVIRYNHIETSYNAIALRDPSNEDPAQNGWIESAMLDHWGEFTVRSAYVYSNLFVNRTPGPQGIIGFGDGGNNGSLQEFREGNLHFYSNRVISVVDGQTAYVGIEYAPLRVPLFDMLNTRSPATVVARNNLFYCQTATPAGLLARFGIMFWGGLADFSQNWINSYVNTAYDTAYAATLAKGPQFTGTGLGGLTESTASPGFASIPLNDFALLPSSPFFGLTAPLHAQVTQRGLIPDDEPVLYPFGIAPVPAVVTLPTISGSLVAGSTITVGGYTFTPLPDSYLFRWYSSGTVISGATAETLSTSGRTGETLRVGVRAVKGDDISTEVLSAPVVVISATTPQNTTAPVISGSAQVGSEKTVSTGAWTNSPVSYSYQAYLDGVEVSGATTNAYTPADTVGNIGKVLQWQVTAYNAGGEFSSAMSNAITLVAVGYDPDANGRFNFAADNDTTIGALSDKWKSIVYGYGDGKLFLTCQDHILRPTHSWTLWNVSQAWYENGQDEDCAVEAEMYFTSGDRGAGIGLRQTASQYYMVTVGVDGVRVFRNGAAVSSRTDMTITSPAVLKVVPDGADLDIYVNGTLAHSYTDGTPLTGGYPGVISNRGGVTPIACGWGWWTDNPL